MGVGDEIIILFKTIFLTNQIDSYSEQVNKLLPKQIKIAKLVSGFKFAESPLWHPQGFVLVADVAANKIYKVTASGKMSLYWDKSGQTGNIDYSLSDMIGSNGMILDDQLNLIVCQHGNHAIIKRTGHAETVMLTNSFNGKPFNSPNDIVRHSNGTLYFTDPPYGLRNQVLQTDKFQSCAGVYSYQNGETKLFSSDLRYPNGICLSSNEKYLFVSSNHHDEPYIWKYEINEKGEITGQSIFIQQNADGIKMDQFDNMYMAVSKGILIVSNTGKRIALIHLPELTTNLAWGKKNGFSLYATTTGSLYHIYG